MPANKVTAEATAGETSELPRVDEAIADVEQLYQALTGGQPLPPADETYAPIPVETDAAEFVTERLDRLLDSLALGQPAIGGAAGSGSELPAETTWSPPLSVWENGDGLLVLLEVPGVDRQNLQLADDGDSLTVKGKRLPAPGNRRLRMTERPLGPFRRRIVLPKGTGGGDLTAHLRDGILEIHIAKPKTGAAGPRTIPIA